MGFCLNKEVSAKFLKTVHSGDFDPEEVANMSSDARREYFGKLLGEENAKDVNTLFESKLVLKNIEKGLENFVKKVGGVTPASRRNMMSQLEKINDQILHPASQEAFLRDLAAQKLGTNISFDEVQQLADHADKLQELATKPDKDGNPSLEYFKELRATKKYVQSLNEHSPWSHLISTFRNLKLASIKTPVKVNLEQALNQVQEGIIKAIAYNRNIGGNYGDALNYLRKAIKVYHQTDFNIGSMNSIDEGNMFGDTFGHLEGQTGIGKGEGLRSQGVMGASKGLLRQGAKAIDRTVIHWLHGEMFNIHYNTALATTADAEATRIARSEGLTGDALQKRSSELFNESMKIGTTDPVASQIRAQAQHDAMLMTNTNETLGAKEGRLFKSFLNKLSGPLRLGDIDVPFSKIPGSIVSNGINNAGPGIVKAAFQFKTAITEGKSTGKYNFTQPVRSLVRVAGTVGAAALITSFIPKDGYDEKKGMVRFGKTWISLELFNLLGPAMAGMLEARDYKPDKKASWWQNNAAYHYLAGAAKGIQHLPGIREAKEITDYGFGDFLNNFVAGAVTPQLVPDIYHAYQEGNPWPIFAGRKVQSNEQMRPKDSLSLEIKQIQNTSSIKRARFNTDSLGKILDKYEENAKTGNETDDSKSELQNKLERAADRNALTPEIAERGNQLLGLTGEDKLVGSEDAVETPDFNKYNKNADGVIEKIELYAKSLVMSPLDAFDKIAKNETFVRHENGTIIVERADKHDPGFSAREKKRLGGGGKEVILDHKIPLELGGTNARDNLELVPKDQAESDDAMENYLAGALHDEKITGAEAQQMIRDYKLSKDKKAETQKIVNKTRIPFTPK